jgi:ABC-type nitrate/sulfonate/bicarbonate transport system permease component
MNSRLISAINKGWPPIVAVVLLLSGWELAVFLLHIDQWFLPSPSGVVREAYASWPRLWLHTSATIEKCLLGFAVGIVTGLLIGVMMHISKPINLAFSPLLIISQNIPSIILAPLFLVWFGYGLLPKILVIALVCFFPIALSMTTGLAETDRNLYNYMRMIGAKRRQIFFKLELPFSLPYLFSGLKISATYSVMGAVIAEWLGSSVGLGYYMTLSSSGYRNDRVFAAVFIIIVLSLAMFMFIGLLQKIIIRWQSDSSKEDA